MNKVTLIFPDTITITQFILEHHISKAEVRSLEQSLTAPLTQDQLITACTQYGAMLKGSANKLIY